MEAVAWSKEARGERSEAWGKSGVSPSRWMSWLQSQGSMMRDHSAFASPTPPVHHPFHPQAKWFEAQTGSHDLICSFPCYGKGVARIKEKRLPVSTKTHPPQERNKVALAGFL